MNSTIKIAFTGHRYLSISQVESHLEKLHKEYTDAIWITGGAVGLDSIAASFAMAHGIRLCLILPFPIHVMSKYWTPDQKRCIQDSWDYAEKTSVLAPAYDVSVYQRRNERMVDLSDMVAAFWDGSSGGTGNCVRYAQKVGKKMVQFSDFSGVKPQEEGSTSSTPSSYREVHGDIFTSDAEVIVNTVNCVGAMGKGIALEFKKRYPDLYAAYRQACARKEIQPGHVWIYQAKDRIIFNASVKDDWRDASRIVWVESCLKELIEHCRTMKVKSLALPWMGAMNGWIPVDEIKASTRKILSDITDFDISVYEIRKNI
ncbi:MAG: macro domain-containing protein [Candidatus Methanoperedens sp.]|nr:macro domain-containing protein [Candidatus Methanoperedens sp.]